MLPLLILDPDPSRQAFYEAVLAKTFRLTIAPDGAKALAAYRAVRPPLVIVCAAAHDPGGAEFCRAIRREEGGERVKILLAGAAPGGAAGEKERALESGADGWAELPFTMESLRLHLRDLIVELSARSTAGRRVEPVETASPPVAEKAETPSPAPPGFGPLSENDRELTAGIGLHDVLERARHLDELDYFHLLGVEADANAAAIRQSYFALARRYHPDRFSLMEDPELRRVLNHYFKRLSEAYQALTDPERRHSYQAQLDSGKGLRLVEKEKKVSGPRAAENEIANPQARKFYAMAVAALNEGKLSAAKLNLALALKLSPHDPVILAKQRELAAPRKE